jgi:hypothetical protein
MEINNGPNNADSNISLRGDEDATLLKALQIRSLDFWLCYRIWVSCSRHLTHHSVRLVPVSPRVSSPATLHINMHLPGSNDNIPPFFPP